MYKVSIIGKSNTGKSTLSRMLIKQLRDNKGYYMSAKELAFADPIKEMIIQMFPTLPKKYLYGSSKFRNEYIPGAFKDGQPLTIRQLLIDLGTEMGRSYMPTVWLDNFDYRFEQEKYKQIIVSAGVRFRDEFEHLRKKGFYQIKLYRDIRVTSVPTHVTETNQDLIADEEFDYVLHNDFSLREMKREVAVNIIPRLKDL